jgi:hypothetical protein
MTTVARAKGPNDQQISLNLRPEWVKEAESMAASMSAEGLTITRADVLRLCVSKGLEVLRKERPAPSKRRRGS